MTKIIPFLLLLVALPTKARSLDNYISFDSGRTHSSVNLDTSIQESNNSDTSFSLTYGFNVSETLSLELGYSNLGDNIIFPLENNKLIQESETYNFQARFQLGTFHRFAFSTHLGFARWSTTIYQQQPRSTLLIASTSSLALSNGLNGKSSLKSNGFTTKAGLGVSYTISEAISLGVEYQHFEQVGSNAALIDRDKLAIGDLAGALQVIPAAVSVDVLSVKLLFKF